MSKLKLGMPSKGRLRDLTIDWFARNGVKIELASRDREYSATFDKFKDIELILLPAGEIPNELASGGVDLGVTGQDLVQENIPEWRQFVAELRLMNFGKADLVIAVPKFWIDVESIDDLDFVATTFRRKNHQRLRIATKYHNLVRSYLREMGIADYQLVHSQVATEGAIKNDYAEVIADIASSGKTLEANHLKVVGSKPILKSQATLYLSRKAHWNKRKLFLFTKLCSLLNFKSSLVHSLIDT